MSIEEMLLSGDHVGAAGSVAQAEKVVLPQARSGNVKMMMLLANVYYTAAGASALQGVLGKLRAVKYLYLAKKWAKRAFLHEGREKDILIALSCIDVRLHERGQPWSLTYGDVHILMCCYSQWFEQVKMRLKIAEISDLDVAVVNRCHQIISSSNNIGLGMLSTATLSNFPATSKAERSHHRDRLFMFLSKNYHNLLDNPPTDERRSLAQVVCRVCRAVGDFEPAQRLANHYTLGDQSDKAHKRA
jgi:hypothetical protein